jgi:hypothetical protein
MPVISALNTLLYDHVRCTGCWKRSKIQILRLCITSTIFESDAGENPVFLLLCFANRGQHRIEFNIFKQVSFLQ